MKKIYSFLIFSISLLLVTGCSKDWLEREPTLILDGTTVWNDPTSATGVLANIYDRLPVHYDLNTYGPMADYDEGMWSGSSNNDRNNIISYPFNKWSLWNYDLIRDINQSLEDLEKSTKLNATQKAQYNAELRFLRAYDYFEMVKRMGGVPLVTSLLVYDFNGDPSYLQQPRNKEEEVYDYIASEIDAIKDNLGNDQSVTRANKYTALALKSRAMLYAASIAKYNNKSGFTPLKTSGGEVGISASRANEYYTKSLEASREIINNGPYALYDINPSKGENFYEAVNSKSANTEVIWVKDYKVPGKNTSFAYNNFPRSIREDNLSSSNITPTLNLVESFEYLDGTNGSLKGVGTGSNTAAGQSDWIFYDKPEDIFAGKDARLYGTVLYPGSTFKGLQLDMQAGVYVWNAEANKYDRIEGQNLNTFYTDGKVLTGSGGPSRNINEVSNSGFYIRKFLDPTPGSSTRGLGSAAWWVKFRIGEIYLNAGEAAFELGLTGDALTYINAVRNRAGFGPNSLDATTLTFERIQNERRVELAFEDHRVWDLIRWREAHELWNGAPAQVNPDASMFALYGYRIIRPGHPNDGKIVYDKFVAPRFQAPRLFQLGNYYGEIDQAVRDNNPTIVKNPYH